MGIFRSEAEQQASARRKSGALMRRRCAMQQQSEEQGCGDASMNALLAGGARALQGGGRGVQWRAGGWAVWRSFAG
jgi:hypothetical protein